MKRCESTYQNVVQVLSDKRLEPVGKPVRCTRVAGHTDPASDDMHRNFKPGHKIKWPDSAAVSVAPATFTPPAIPEELCGIEGCAFTPHEGKHSWQ